MPGLQPSVSDPDRMRQVTIALRLVGSSVIFGVLSGAASVAAGLANHSLSVLAVGLGVLADVTGSATLVWRFQTERRQPGQSQAAEVRAAIVVASALAVVSCLIVVEAAVALATGSRPGTSGVTLIAASISLVVLTPLAYAKWQSRHADGQPGSARRWHPQRHWRRHQPVGSDRAGAISRTWMVVGRPDCRADRGGDRRHRGTAHRPGPATI